MVAPISPAGVASWPGTPFSRMTVGGATHLGALWTIGANGVMVATLGGAMMWYLDFPSLILIIAAGAQLGLQSIFGWDMTGAFFGRFENIVFEAMGLSAIWQGFRQRFN